MRDLHVHTLFSSDSHAPMESHVQRALTLGLETVCFTDHVDYNPVDFGYLFYQPDAFFAEFDALKARFAGRVELLAGMEFGETHLYREQFRELARRPYDYVIGSVHWVDDVFPGDAAKRGIPAEEYFDRYWQVMLEMVRDGGFDALGHVDFPKRYYRELRYSEDVVREIFARLVDSGAVIEINTSSLRKGCDAPMPGEALLALYREAGGRRVTVGSDAHTPEDLNADYGAAAALIRRYGLEEVKYVGRKQIPVATPGR